MSSKCNPKTWQLASLATFALAASACDSTNRVPGDSPGARLNIAISPLTLSGATDACYTLTDYKTFANGTASGNVVWTRTPVCASDYGVGSGATGDVQTTAIAYTGACDASLATNDVALVLDGIYSGGQSPSSQDGGTGTALGASAFYNPCPASEPCVLTEPCNPFEDTAVSFDITVMRDGQKGFFDVSVQFEDIFCSAKFDCGYDGGAAIKQVIGLDGKPKDTAVLGFACTAGTSSPSHLYMTRLHLTCAGGVSQDIDPVLSGNLFDAPHALPLGATYPNDAVFQAVTSFGQLTETSFTEYYWNVSLGFDLTRANGCTLTARATATEGAFTDATLGSGLTPSNATYPYVDFNIPIGTRLVAGRPQLACASSNGFQNKLNASGSGVITRYTPVSTRVCFKDEYPGVTVVGSVSDAARAMTCTPPPIPPPPVVATCHVPADCPSGACGEIPNYRNSNYGFYDGAAINYGGSACQTSPRFGGWCTQDSDCAGLVSVQGNSDSFCAGASVHVDGVGACAWHHGGQGAATPCDVDLDCAGSGADLVCTGSTLEQVGACVCSPSNNDPLCMGSDECSPNPCLNGGACYDGVNSFTCGCAPGFSGSTCAIAVDGDDCAGSPCLNGGACTDGVNSFTCSCVGGYTGLTCATPPMTVGPDCAALLTGGPWNMPADAHNCDIANNQTAPLPWPSDLSGANLAGANFSGLSLVSVNFSGANLQGANFAGTNLGGNTEFPEETACNFTGANLSGANFEGAYPGGGLELDGSLNPVVPNVIVPGINLTGATVVGASGLNPVADTSWWQHVMCPNGTSTGATPGNPPCAWLL